MRATQDVDLLTDAESAMHPFAADGGVDAPIESQRNPYERLDDLMVVVEALCPTWPEREPFTGEEIFKL